MTAKYPRRPTLVTVDGRPATQAERDAIAFEPIPVTFYRTSEDWAMTYHWLRFAAHMVAKTPEQLLEDCDKLAKRGYATKLLNDMCSLKEEMAAMAELLEAASSRCFLMFERLGYSPDDPPPDNGEDLPPEMGGAA